MTPFKQLYRHKPEEGVIGDCWRTCFGCLLDIQPQFVPHFLQYCWNDGLQARANAKNWLAKLSLSYVEVPYGGTLQDVLRTCKDLAPGMHYLLGGESRTGVGHSVVCCDDQIVWDPSLDDAGIIGPMDDGHYWVTWLIPMLLAKDKVPA